MFLIFSKTDHPGKFLCLLTLALICGSLLQEAQKLLQPSDKVLRTMALELAEFQVIYAALSVWLTDSTLGNTYAYECVTLSF